MPEPFDSANDTNDTPIIGGDIPQSGEAVKVEAVKVDEAADTPAEPRLILRKARTAALRLLYARHIRMEPAGQFSPEDFETLRDMLGIDHDDMEMPIVRKIVGEIEMREQELDDRIKPLLVKGWHLGRLSRMDRLILRLSIYMMMYDMPPEANNPVAAVVSFAIEMVKQYSSEESVPFVHGMLGSFSRNLRSQHADDPDQ